MALTFQLKDFDGPLDLLLFLINKEKIDIKDVFVSQITDQYISLVRSASDLDMDEATGSRIAERSSGYCLDVGRDRKRNHRMNGGTIV